MMRIVIDSNVIYAALRVKNSKIRDLLYNSDFEFFTPKFLFIEIFRHKDRLVKKAKITEEEVYEVLSAVIQKIEFIGDEAISMRSYSMLINLSRM